MSDITITDLVSKDIIELLNLQDLPVEKQDEYRKLAIETVNDRAFSKLTDILDEKGLLDQFQDLPENDEAMRTFLTENGIDLDELVAEEAILYKAQMKTINDVISIGVSVKSVEEK